MPEAEPAPSLPPLRDVMARHDLKPRKSLGQNFLLDPRITARIAGAAGDLTGTAAIEIGAGPGGLTRALLAQGARQVVAVERDPRCVVALAELAEAFPGRLRVVEADALAVDAAGLAPAPRAVIANLPYNIATPLVLGWLRDATAFTGFTLMFQREVADRICAVPGSRTYGRLSIAAQWPCAVKRLFDIPPGAFIPLPKVTSTLVSLTPRPEPLAPADHAALERVVAAAFGQRRKMLRASLKTLGGDTLAMLSAAAIEPTARAEEISIERFCALARAYTTLQ
ncbi:MAG: 16S rRNA (adenine(1518)-N(6)/adenine(1519)-N(6))-dimethyltransferase RsmA [Pseudomonadota bacterium]|nr:16S rRNA (adenine(1518)-N(6)/adenine(1519)-N(6))-dimethyltransferase RsmA [Pseudomonadota bacterium]